MTETISGWLLDVYPNETNLTLWIIGEDGKRYRFVQDFSATIYAAGPAARLRALWKWLNGQAIPVHLSRTERRDILTGTGTFQEAPAPHPTGIPLQVQVKLPRLATVLAVEVLQPVKLDELFRKMAGRLPGPDLLRRGYLHPAAVCGQVRYLSAGTRPAGSARRKDRQHRSAGYSLGTRTGSRAAAHALARTGLRPEPPGTHADHRIVSSQREPV